MKIIMEHNLNLPENKQQYNIEDNIMPGRV